LPFACPALDAVLGGGLPRGGITEIVGRVSSGRTTLGHTLIASATRAGECVAWVDVPNALDPESIRQAGANVERILWLHPRDRSTALRSVEHVLGAGGFRLVVLDLDEASSSSWVPVSVWMRLARAALRYDAAVVVLGPSSLAGPFAALSLEVRNVRRMFSDLRGPCPLFEGTVSATFLRRRKDGPPIESPVDLIASVSV
jgi:RecA/RadA recombinase